VGPRIGLDDVKMKKPTYPYRDSTPDSRPVEGSCEHGNEPSGSLKCWEVPEWLQNWLLLKKGSAP
jgi:hypothetical protein